MSQPLSSRQFLQLVIAGVLIPITATALLSALQYYSWGGISTSMSAAAVSQEQPGNLTGNSTQSDRLFNQLQGRPQLSPQPEPQEVWECEVAVIGGSLGGVAAAAQSMTAGAKTCLIELSPWLGGQISSQGVSAIDESYTMKGRDNFAPFWEDFKDRLANEVVRLPEVTGVETPQKVADTNSCWVGALCFLPEVGARVAEDLLRETAQRAPGSRWDTATAFKGAEFDPTGKFITAIYAVHRMPRQADYVPLGRPSIELPVWYSWSSDDTFEKYPIKMQAPAGKRLIVIDATDTGEFVGWAGIPYRLGSEARTTTSEFFASRQDNPDCTQAFTFPFTLAIADDNDRSLEKLAKIEPAYSRPEHQKEYNLIGFPMFTGGSFFHYRRIVSTTQNEPHSGNPAPGDITMVNWNQGNDWIWMNPPLILNEAKISGSGQHQNWMGGLSISALRYAEEHAMLFAEWLIKNKAEPDLPLSYLWGADSPMATQSGLSMMPYIREGRRILGRQAYGQPEFMLREPDLRKDMRGARDFSRSLVAITHYPIDIHGCRYRNWDVSWEASSAPLKDESLIRPIDIPLEALIPQGVDNLLIGGKSIAATHIVNASTRIHYGEWVIGSAAGATAGWLTQQNQPDLTPATIGSQKQMPKLQQHLIKNGLRIDW